MTVNEYVEVYGGRYCQLIVDSLKWLDEKEKCWGVSVDRDAFLSNLITKVVQKENAGYGRVK